MKKNLVITLLMVTVTATVFVGCGKKNDISLSTESTEDVMVVLSEELATEDVAFIYQSDGVSTVDTITEDVINNAKEKEEQKNSSSNDTTEPSGINGNSNTSSGNTSSGNSTGSTNTDNTNSESSTPVEAPVESQVETPTPEPEPSLPNFPYALDTLYENGDGTGYIYIIDCAYKDVDAWEARWGGVGAPLYDIYYGEQIKKIEAVGGLDNSWERLGEYAEGCIKKISYGPNPYL